MKTIRTFGFILCLVAPTFSQTGLFVPELAHFDPAISNFMTTWDLPGASVAIVKDGRLVYARGFGFSNKETGEVVEPHHQFRIASVSKPITAVAVMKLYDDGLIALDDRVFGAEAILNDDIFAAINDARVLDITVRHLLHHTAGWNRAVSGDPMFKPIEIANAMGVSPPAPLITIIQYMLARALDFTPGVQIHYSNFGYLVLGRVIEKLTGMTYEQYVKSAILDPLGASRMQLGKNLQENKLTEEVNYYDFPEASLTSSVYGTGKLVPWPYGGFNLEAMDAHGGWVASATDLLHLMVAVDGFPTKPDILQPATISLMTSTSPTVPNIFAMGWAVEFNNWWLFGSVPGTSSLLYRRNDGVAWAVLFNSWPLNRQNFFTVFDTIIKSAVNAVSSWPVHDLFEMTTSVENGESGAPQLFSLTQNYPNPFNPSTKITYELPDVTNVKLEIYNVLSERIRILVNEEQAPGVKTVEWQGRDDKGTLVPSGIYYYKISTTEFLQTKKMLLLK